MEGEKDYRPRPCCRGALRFASPLWSPGSNTIINSSVRRIRKQVRIRLTLFFVFYVLCTGDRKGEAKRRAPLRLLRAGG